MAKRLEGWAAYSGASGPSFETNLAVLLRMRFDRAKMV